ncbi:ACP S-malonyltransferase [Alkaliphilus peptidifermentans]|uniref:Malonyl CoA-acyl carrier protein transacylase n=1 Tax=Alkaliphilus peptidifermentans DSM 18978 TaxID=1120976 RepID=A0A1G5JB38_9FIRM|nr:ACP S-malonyltransferase [Alkaliphilus peptidifermentans]SCY84928.1 [Acyl-carrier-protein] S-malonyltransferase [Alkaliphilus peptidifermentans DSM 18978]
MGKSAFVFPGQGAQYVGMGKEITENFSSAKEVFEEASDFLGYDMKKLCFEGPDEELIKTENTQPAILTTSIALLKVLENEGISCDMTAGLSLGEYASLVKSNVIRFADAVRIVRNRGKYMQEAVPQGLGTMAAVLGLGREELQKCLMECQQYGVVETANYNSPGQIVISGEMKAVQSAVSKAIEFGAKKAVILPVSAPFHCSLLKPAGDRLKDDLLQYSFNSPEIGVVTNVDAKLLEGKDAVIPSLVKQVSNSVLWQDSIEFMIKEGVDTFIEIGPGKTLSAFIKKIAKNINMQIETKNIEDMESFKSLINSF